MPDGPEPRLPCPVCVGVKLDKTALGPEEALVLDHCRRCGGVWFDAGEVRELRELDPDAPAVPLAVSDGPRRVQCHGCRAMMDRDVEACPACGRENVLDCPECRAPMERGGPDGLVLDACRDCRGVWFDHDEIAAIWNLELERTGVASGRRPDEGWERHFVEAMAKDPIAAGDGGRALFYVAPEVLSHAPDAAAGALEAGGEAAGAVFEVVVEVVAEML